MNLILLDGQPDRLTLEPDDARARHIREVLRMGPGDTLFVGAVNGPRGKATIERIDAGGSLHLSFAWEEDIPKPLPVHLLVGLPRPQTARKILQEATTLGAARIDFFASEKGEASYAQSSLWTTNEWEKLRRQGAEQAFSTTIPPVQLWSRLPALLENLPGGPLRVALDLYEATTRLAEAIPPGSEVILAIGPEGGWSPGERAFLRAAGFALASFEDPALGTGARVLRVESAVVAALGLLAYR